MTSFYQDIPKWVDGQLVSATRLNQMLANMDAAYGSDQRQESMHPLGWNINASGLGTWYGWCVFNGGRLVVEFDQDLVPYTVTFDETAKVRAHTVTVTGSGPHIIPLPNVYTQWDAYRIKVGPSSNQPPRFAYLNSPTATIGSMPVFANGTVLSTSDLNTIINSTETLWWYHNQPVAGGVAMAFGAGENQGVGAGGGVTVAIDGGFYVWSEHRHSQFQFYITTGRPHRQQILKWQVYDNTGAWKTVWVYPFSAKLNQQFRVRLAQAAEPLDLTVGEWYEWRFQHLDNPAGTDTICPSNVYWYGEERYETALNWEPLGRWEHGDVLEGNAALPPRQPRLADMSSNLEWLGSRSRWCNPVQRQPITTLDDDGKIVHVGAIFQRRAHRWLAYGVFDVDTPATMRWSVDDRNVFQAYDLPSIDEDKINETAYFDLEQSPIKVGQTFYVQGAQYAIQTPDVK